MRIGSPLSEFLASEGSNRVIKRLYFHGETLAPSLTSANADDEAMHGAKDEPQATGSEARGPAGGAGNNEIVLPKRYA